MRIVVDLDNSWQRVAELHIPSALVNVDAAPVYTATPSERFIENSTF